MGHDCNHTSGLGGKDRKCGFEANLGYLNKTHLKTKQSKNKQVTGLSLVVHTFNPSIWEAVAGEYF